MLVLHIRLHRMLLRCVACVTAIGLLTPTAGVAVRGANDGVTLGMRDRAGNLITSTIDGNTVRAVVTLPQPTTQSTRVVFHLSGDAQPAAECTIAAGAHSCESPDIDTLGWYWSDRAHALRASFPDRRVSRTPADDARSTKPGQTRTIAAGEDDASAELRVTVRPRPVILVHGFNSDHATWRPYVDADGFLDELGLSGFAVGDGQAEGALNTGNAVEPRRRTNSLAQNAAILAGYIDEVRSAVGAEKVDIIAHSMGGLIARNYVSAHGTPNGVAQLLTLGTPMAGTHCAVLPASLGLMLPASIEIQPSYVTDIFNRRITRRNGSRFHLLAGTPREVPLQSPCTDAPSDLVVSSRSVRGIQAEFDEMPVLHTDMTSSREIFEAFVAPLLKRSRSDWRSTATETDAAASPAAQFTRVHTGHLNPGESTDVVIDIEPGVAVASFALFDTSRSLEIVVTGASGKPLTLDVKKNGLVRVEDPAALLYLGYGFENPKPGRWSIRLTTTNRTPASGADFALTAQFHGGARIEATTDAAVVRQGERIAVRAHLTRDDVPLELRSARALWRNADGELTTLDMPIHDGGDGNGDRAGIEFVPTHSGLHSVDVELSGVDPSGMIIERAAFLAFEVEPSASAPWRGIFTAAAVAVVCVILVVVSAFVVMVLVRRRRRLPA